MRGGKERRGGEKRPGEETRGEERRGEEVRIGKKVRRGGRPASPFRCPRIDYSLRLSQGKEGKGKGRERERERHKQIVGPSSFLPFPICLPPPPPSHNASLQVHPFLLSQPIMVGCYGSRYVHS